MTETMDVVKPYNDKTGKKEQVAKMFNNIAPRYDFLNHLLSLGIDRKWRKKAVKMLKENKPKRILDVATGTGDFAIEIYQIKPEEIIGVDISVEMLAHGNAKILKKKLKNVVLMKGDSENLQFYDDSFDAITVGFGVRNFENLEKGIKEMVRVLKPGGNLVILEFSKPSAPLVKGVYNLYFNYVLPLVGSLFSKDGRAYSYLPESVNAFPEGASFKSMLLQSGLSQVNITPLSFGIASIYFAKK